MRNILFKFSLFAIFGVAPMYYLYLQGCRELTVYWYVLLFSTIISVAYNIPNVFKRRVAHGN